MKKEFLEIGKIVNVHGLKGDVKVMPWCDDPEFLCEFESLYFGKTHESRDITAARVFKNTVILHVDGCDSIEQAERLRGTVLYIHRDEVELEEGVYFVQDLIGLNVVNADDETLVYGVLKDVQQTGANDVYEIRNEEMNKTYWIPAIPDVIIETDVDGGIMKIRPLEGLLDAN